MNSYQTNLNSAIWVAHTLFEKGLVSGSTGNISFLDEGKIYITKSGSCFGRVDENSFAIIDMEGNILDGIPSKEYPIHLAIYQCNPQIKGIVHTHSLNSTLFSCLKNVNNKLFDLFSITPYLKMLTNGKLRCIEYASPGSKQLFDYFKDQVNEEVNAYIMKNHGVTIAGKDLYHAFNLLEEFEMSAKIHFKINQYKQEDFTTIED